MSALPARAIAAYRQTEVQSRTPLELVVMLYDGLLRSMAEAREAITRHDIPGRRASLERALSIVSELQSTLDMQAGGAIAQSLDGLYVYVTGRLVDASVRQQVEPMDEAIRVITTLREGWEGIGARPAGLAGGA